MFKHVVHSCWCIILFNWVWFEFKLNLNSNSLSVVWKRKEEGNSPAANPAQTRDQPNQQTLLPAQTVSPGKPHAQGPGIAAQQARQQRPSTAARVAGTLCRPWPAEQTAGSLPGWDTDSALSPGWSREKKRCGAGHGFRLGWLLDYFLLPFFFKPHSNYLNSNSIWIQATLK